MSDKVISGFFGKHHTEESKKRMSIAHIGKKRTKEEIRKISEKMKGRHLSKKHRLNLKNTFQKGNKHPNWKGGRKKQLGYILILCHEHPFCSKYGYVSQHRLVIEKHMGRTLLPTEVVHHINGIRDDNRIENLMLFSNNSKHIAFEEEVKRGKR